MIRAYTGKTGSGKTYLMIKDAYKFWKKGIDIYSNTKLEFKASWYHRKNHKYGEINYFEEITEVIDIKHGLVLFDEAQVLFNARNWESLPDEFQYKLQQHRKHKIDLICTTQNLGTIDITYRRLIHSWNHCKNILQLGSSPKIFFGLFQIEEKDIDMLYNSVDDLLVDTIKKKFHIIHYFSKVLYDTMFDIGFRKFKTLWLSHGSGERTKSTYLIIPKKMTIKQAIQEIKMFETIQLLATTGKTTRR
jgi:hypothetical protein